ncbi:MAG: excinuclease ABC subunit C [Flavobacteriales bacterium]|nr:excinuclease ABC subunit C [Flavobacteriales bacterium]|tara:strand:- start:55139 stop:56875 length:1737 start_codon:yes stop_codon:yes gene_type:complete
MLKKTILLKNKASLLPNKVGVYFFLNKQKVLYVGKAVKIRARVLSYFKDFSNKNVAIVESSNDIKYILVDSEEDAFFLENSLIKKHQPKYNILLKDDKTFPWLCVKNERFPRVFISRKKDNSSDFYFGPYVSRKTLNNLFGLIKSLYPTRTCNYNLSEKNIASKKYKVCLEYHLKNCLGPCEGFCSDQEYDKNTESIKNILSGKFSFVLNDLKKKLKYNTENLFFEKCEVIKNQIFAVQNLKNKSVVVSEKNINLDCFYIYSIKNNTYVNFIRVIEGSVIFLNNYIFNKNYYYSDGVVLENIIKTIYINYNYVSDLIISNISFSNFLKKKIIVPKRGYKKSILNFSHKNLISFINSKNSDFNLLSDLKEKLYLKKIPFHIECFDVSNLMGSNTTSSCVVFKGGKSSKKDYKSYILKDNKIDDYESISESVYRRYKNKNNIPDLIIIDGGKGHLRAALNILSSLCLSGVDVISIAKKEEIIYKKNLKEIILNKNSKTLHLIQYIRNEAHRFCLKKHRIKRKNNFLNSDLNNINLIGNKTVFKLLKKFKSINNIKKASLKDLKKIIGNNKAIIIYKHFKN